MPWWCQNTMAPDDPCSLSTLMRTDDPNGGNHGTTRQGLSSWMLKKSANLSIARLSCGVLFRSPRRAGERNSGVPRFIPQSIWMLKTIGSPPAITRITHEGFYCNRRYAATTSLTAGGLAARSVNILLQVCLPLSRLRAPVSLGVSAGFVTNPRE